MGIGCFYIFLRGFQPVFCNSPNTRVISTRIVLPELGSAAPPIIHASRWLPMMMVSSAAVPLIIPITFHIGLMLLSMRLVNDSLVFEGPEE